MPLALWALMICVFAVGTAEYVVSGILPQLASGLHVSTASAGQLVTFYAITIVIAGPLLTAVTGRMRRKPLMLALLVTFIGGTALSALAPDFGVLVAGRVIAALCHATFFALCTVVAAEMVPPDRRGSAIAMVAGGLNLATVLGVPVGTLIGHHEGWRSTFWVIVAVAALGTVGVALLVPGESADASVAGLREEIAVFRRRPVQLALAMTVFGYAGVFAAYTYIVPLLQRITGYGSNAVSVLLLIFGVGALAGNFAAGKLVDRALMRSLMGILAMLAVVMAVFAVTDTIKPVTAVMVFLFGFMAFATVPALQTRIISGASGAPTLAAATNISAFQLANALGAGLGGLVVASSLGLRGTPWVAIVPTLIGLGLTFYAYTWDRRGPERSIGGDSDRVSVSQGSNAGG